MLGNQCWFFFSMQYTITLNDLGFYITKYLYELHKLSEIIRYNVGMIR